MSKDQKTNHPRKDAIAVGAVLGVGIGAAIGMIIDELGSGVWIGAVIGVGLGMLANYLRA